MSLKVIRNEISAVQQELLLKLEIPVPVDWSGKPRYNKRNDLFTAAGHEENKLWK